MPKIYSLLLIVMLTVCNGRAQDVQSFKGAKPFTIKGNISAGMWYYGTSGIASRRQPFSWYITGAPVVSIYGISLPFSMTVSEQERRYAQPFNRYGVSPHYKWITLHAGYRNVRFSDFTLAGVNMLGGGLEANPGIFRFGVMAGRINRAVSEDTLSGETRSFRTYPVYKRMAYAFKIGIGKTANFFDLSFFKGYDDYRSIKRPVTNTKVTPMENAVLGFKTRLKLLKKLTFIADGAVSALTRNLYASRLDSSSTSETDIKWLKKASGLLEINSTTGIYSAGRASLSYGFGIGSIAARYERIGQDFQSLGAFFFNNDNEQWTISPSFGLLNNKVSVSGSYGVGRDNLKGKKYATTYRKIGSLNLGWQLSEKLNIGVNYANYGTNQNRGTGDLFNDTTAISIVNSSYGFNAAFTETNTYQVHSMNLSGGVQDAKDKNRFTSSLTDVASLYGNLGYSLTAVETQSTASLNVNWNKTKTPDYNIMTFGPTVSVSIPFFDKKLRPMVSGTYYLRKTNGQQDGTTLTFNGNLGYSFGKQTFSMGGNILRNKSNTSLTPTFNEWRGTLTYGYSF